MSDAPLVSFRACAVGDPLAPALAALDWELLPGESWAVCGPNGGGKSAFAAALAGRLPVTLGEGGEHRNAFSGRSALVSFEEASALIARERANDDSDYVEGGVDQGTTARAFIAAALGPAAASAYPAGAGLEAHPAVLSCGVGPVLDRGLKRLSTGEIRRTLLARALAGEYALLVLDEPYEGLDAAARETLQAILEDLCAANAETGATPAVALVADRWERIPRAVNRVLEFTDRSISYRGSRADYEGLVAERRRVGAARAEVERRGLLASLAAAEKESEAFAGRAAAGASSGVDPAAGAEGAACRPLVEFRGATVEYSGRKVIDALDWTVLPGEHWLIRGPNGSGKTTILELITGDNPQVFRNDVRLFGSRRGSGETIWELKARMGIVSYRLHLEYRFLEDLTLEEVLVSGLRDSIGLYGNPAGDGELLLARLWLSLAGFSGRGEERFGRLSYGEQRALLVARGAVKGPELLILDEPCHGLDDGHRALVLNVLGAVAAHGRSTLLYVTHDPAELLPGVDRVLELRPGESPMWTIILGG